MTIVRNSIAAAVASLFAAFAGRALGHDFWVQPRDYWTTPDRSAPYQLLVGHGASRQRSPITAGRIVRFVAVGPSGAVTDLRGSLHLGAAADDGSVRLLERGTYVFALQTDDRARSELPAIRFNDYLRFEGLTPALEDRRRRHRMDAAGTESYSRQAKVIVAVGAPGANAWVTKPLGLPLEIVTEVNPYTTPAAASLPVRVYSSGRPLAGALVMLTDLANDADPREAHSTDASGRATFAMPKQGNWVLNVVWTKAAPRSSDVDYQTIFSSLSFGFSGMRGR
jgi:uncharacterized GH25 family protein